MNYVFNQKLYQLNLQSEHYIKGFIAGLSVVSRREEAKEIHAEAMKAQTQAKELYEKYLNTKSELLKEVSDAAEKYADAYKSYANAAETFANILEEKATEIEKELDHVPVSYGDCLEAEIIVAKLQYAKVISNFADTAEFYYIILQYILSESKTENDLDDYYNERKAIKIHDIIKKHLELGHSIKVIYNALCLHLDGIQEALAQLNIQS